MPTPAVTGPSVLVKKTDGSTIRVSLSSLKQASTLNPTSLKFKEENFDSKTLAEPTQNAKSTSTQTRAEPVQSQTSVKKIEKRNSPLLIKTKRTPPKTVWKAEDHASLLDEALSHEELLDKELSDKIGPDYALRGIFQEFPVVLSSEVQARAHSLVLSFLKGVRDKAQFHEYAVAPFASGGLGLTKEQSARLTLLMEEKKKTLAFFRQEELKALKPNISKKSKLKVESEALALNQTSQALSTTTPVKDIFRDIALAQAPKPPEPVETLTHDLASVLLKQGARSRGHRSLSSGQLRAVGVPSASLHDMTPPVEPISKATGPVEEMFGFSLMDFRRLAEDPESAAKQVSAKFEALKGESFLLYLEARRAWFQNFLFRQYQALLVRAINEGTGLSQILSKESAGQSPSLEECFAFLEVHKALRT
ncbi:MAG: hypothetical protein HYY51_04885 [Candidatus Magasanikbacteria bacterium]|nr:hypothetical protein [Candidatus Magasanikbacteria bacterium]